MKKRTPSPLLQEEMPKGLEEKILRRTAPQLFELQNRAANTGYRRRAFALLFSGLTAAVLVVAVWLRLPPKAMERETELASVDFEMLEQLDLLRDMRNLENDDLLHRVKDSKGWQKTRKGS